MKQNLKNAVHLEGLVYQHDLKKKVTGPKSKVPNTEFITGTVDVVTDDAMTNIVTVNFTFVTALNAKGKENSTFTVLSSILDGSVGTVMTHGIDKASKVRIDTAVGVNDFYSDRNGKSELVTVKRNEGGFIHLAGNDYNEDEKARNTFECDMLITQVVDVEENPEIQLEERVILKGYVFSFRKEFIPVDFVATAPGAMNYFRNLGATPNTPVFTRVKGRQVSTTIVIENREEGAFGGASVQETRRSRKEYLVTWAQAEPYLWDDESTITAADVQEGLAARDLHLATVKQSQEEYKATKGNALAASTPAPAAAPATAKSGFNF